MNREEKKIVVLGAGESGAGAAFLAHKKGFEVFVSDHGEIEEKHKELFDKNNIEWEEFKHTEEKILLADEVVKSPGIPEDTEILKKIRKRAIPVISEIEFAGRFTNARMICITGSNGKTTTTNMIWHMLKKAGINVAIAGNVGQSFARKVAQGDVDYYVLELSSFQLDGMYDFKADIAVLMNITPDHLDRYGYQMQNYIDSKFRILRNQTEKEFLIYCDDDPVIKKELDKINPKVTRLPFSIKRAEGQTAYIDQGRINFNYKSQQMTMTITDLALKGKHNTYNSMAAGIAGQVLNIRKETIRRSLSDFQGVEHRLEPVIKVHGIMFINDSKATNVNSTWYALESMTGEVVLILGGVDKGNDYSSLKDLIKGKVKALICLGMDNSKIISAFEEMPLKIEEARSMNEAVKKAYSIGKKGDTVLLSPACASFDLFENYEDRGRQFKQLVRNL